jgi:hypothetical protein
MKSNLKAVAQEIISDANYNETTGFIYVPRDANTYNLRSYYTDGTTYRSISFANFFQDLDNQ